MTRSHGPIGIRAKKIQEDLAFKALSRRFVNLPFKSLSVKKICLLKFR